MTPRTVIPSAGGSAARAAAGVVVATLCAMTQPCAAPASGAGPADTLVWPAPPERARIRFEESLTGSAGRGSGGGFFGKLLGALFGGSRQSTWLVQPVGIAVAPGGALYVADPGARGVHIIGPGSSRYELITETKFGPFRSPVGCAVDRRGRVYVADSERGDVVVLDDDGDGELVIAGGMERPVGVQVSGDTLFAADAGLHRIFLYSLKGAALGSFGGRGAGAGEFNYPVHLAVRDSLFVLDALNYRVQTLGRDGAFGSVFGSVGNVAGRFAMPKSVALDSDGNLYVADGLMDVIQIFDRAGRLLLIFGRNGTRDGEFVGPSGIAIGPDDRVYVVDAMNRRIQVFRYLR